MRLGTRPPTFASVTLTAIVLAASACGGSDETAAPPAEPATATVEVAVAAPTIVRLHEENGSGQTGTATITPAGGGIDIQVQVDDQGVGQLALISRGSCESLGPPFAGLAELTSDGQFPRTSDAARYDDGAPISAGELEAGDYAVVVVDASFRGGPLEQIPTATRLLNAPDPEGPFGGTPYVLAACGDIPG